MGDSIFEFADKFGVESPFDDWLEEEKRIREKIEKKGRGKENSEWFNEVKDRWKSDSKIENLSTVKLNEIDFDFDKENFTELIYFLREKKHYNTFKERFFDLKDEFPIRFRLNTNEKLDSKQGQIRVSRFVHQLNKVFEKYNLNTALRKIHFLAQAYHETASFRASFEGRTPENTPSNYKGGFNFQGRGIKQITHDYNYLEYYDYLNATKFFNFYIKHKVNKTSVTDFILNNDKIILVKANPSKGINEESTYPSENGLDIQFLTDLREFAKSLATSAFHSVNSAGWFFKKKKGLLNAVDKGFSITDITNVTKLVNGGTNGLDDRIRNTTLIKEFIINKINNESK